MAVYEIKSLQSSFLLGSFSTPLAMEILCTYARGFINTASSSGAATEVEFPTSVSSKLRKAMIHDYSIGVVRLLYLVVTVTVTFLI